MSLSNPTFSIVRRYFSIFDQLETVLPEMLALLGFVSSLDISAFSSLILPVFWNAGIKEYVGKIGVNNKCGKKQYVHGSMRR